MSAARKRSALRSTLDGLAAGFPVEGAELWREAEDAYRWFLEPRLSPAEASKRWSLVVHLVHNFKSQVRIGIPVWRWPPWQTDTPPGANDAGSREIDSLQLQILDSVNEEFLSGKGVGVPIRSALLSLIDPDRYAIIDRWAFMALAGSTGGSSPPLELPTALGLKYPDDCYEDAPRKFRWPDYGGYMDALRSTAHAFDLTLRATERALYSLGQRVGPDKGLSWGEYREHLRTALGRESS